VQRPMDGRGRGHQIQPLEAEVADGVHGGDEVPEVDRVERPAENTDALGRHGEKYGRRGRACQAWRGDEFKVQPAFVPMNRDYGGQGFKVQSGRRPADSSRLRRDSSAGFKRREAGEAVRAALNGARQPRPAAKRGRLAMNEAVGWLAVFLVIGGATSAGGPESAPAAADITLLEEEAGAGGESPASPFAEPGDPGTPGPRTDAVPGYVELSSGAKIFGRIYTTRGKRLKIFNVEKEIYEYVPVPAVREIETIVEWERMEREWRFKEAGSPEKVYTGRSYAARKFAYRLTLLGGHTITGHIVGQPLYVGRPSRASGSSDGSNDDGRPSAGSGRSRAGSRDQGDRFVLHDRQKGPLDTTLEDLVYLKRVVLHEEERPADSPR